MTGRQPPTDAEPDWAALERALGVRFKERALLRQAATHRSYLNERPGLGMESNERLEFIGDAFLGWTVAQELYARCPDCSEGDLTRARAAIVSGRSLASAARSIGLGAHLYLGEGEEATGGRDRPSVLAASLEAVLAAVVLDRGTQAGRRLALRWFGAQLDAVAAGAVPRDAKSALQEHAQREGIPLPAYEVVEEAGPSHDRRYRVSVRVGGRVAGEGEGRRKRDAEQAAAAQALRALISGAAECPLPHPLPHP